MKTFTKGLILWFIMGMVYMYMETVSRWAQGMMLGYIIGGMTQTYWSLTGWTSLWMQFVGGAAGLFSDSLNKIKYIKTWPMILQSLLAVNFGCCA